MKQTIVLIIGVVIALYLFGRPAEIAPSHVSQNQSVASATEPLTARRGSYSSPEAMSDSPSPARPPLDAARQEVQVDEHPRGPSDGYVILYGTGGSELTHQEGSFMLTSLDFAGFETAQMKVDFAGGRWKQEGAPGSTWRVSELRVGRLRIKLRNTTVQMQTDGTPVVAGDLLYEGGLRVVDAHTREELKSIELGIEDRNLDADPLREYPSAKCLQQLLGQGLTSPLELPAAEGQNDYFVRAPGYAWQRISLSGNGQDALCALVPGGALQVSIHAETGGRTRRLLQLYRAGEETTQPVATRSIDTTRTFHLESLPVGKYTARVVAVRGKAVTRLLTEQSFEVAESSTTHLRLDTGFDSHQTRPAVISGIVSSREGANLAGLSVRIDRIVRAKELAEGGDGERNAATSARPIVLNRLEELQAENTYRWGPLDLDPGSYRVTLWPIGSRLDFDLVAGEQRTLDFHVPQLSNLHIWPLDRESGSTLKLSRLTWRPILGSGPGPWRTIHQTTAQGTYQLRTLADEVELSFMAEGYLNLMERTAVQPGFNEVAVSLDRSSPVGIELAFATDGVEVPVDPAYWTRIKVLNSDGKQAALGLRLTGAGPGGSMSVASATFDVAEPGLYRVKFGPLGEYGTPEDVELNVGVDGLRMPIELVSELP